MSPLQQLVALSAPVLGIVIWWLFRWSRKKVGLASILLIAYRMKRRIKRGGGSLDDRTLAKLKRDADRIDRAANELSE